MFLISWTIWRVKREVDENKISKSVIPGRNDSRKMSFWGCINADRISSSDKKNHSVNANQQSAYRMLL